MQKKTGIIAGLETMRLLHHPRGYVGTWGYAEPKLVTFVGQPHDNIAINRSRDFSSMFG
jgi:hypothetical protein